MNFYRNLVTWSDWLVFLRNDSVKHFHATIHIFMHICKYLKIHFIADVYRVLVLIMHIYQFSFLKRQYMGYSISDLQSKFWFTWKFFSSFERGKKMTRIFFSIWYVNLSSYWFFYFQSAKNVFFKTASNIQRRVKNT